MKALFGALLLACFSVSAAAVPVVPSPPQIGAEAYLLMDAATGEVLVEHNADMRLPPASLTKMMTSYVLASELAAGRVKNEDQVPISTNAWSQNPLFVGSSLMWIEPGKSVSLGDLHLGIVVPSGNDATVAIAEYIGGNEAAFADMMNAHAEALGMRNTYYMNSHGLPHPDHLTSARDLAILSRALISKYPEAYALYKVREFTYNDIRQFNRNTLLGEDPTVDGIKTGYTSEAGYCLVASAERRDMRLISVVMGSDSRNGRKTQSQSLLNYGFRFFESVDLYPPATELGEAEVWKGQLDQVSVGLAEGLSMTIPRGQGDKLETRLTLQPQLEAPISQGQQLGTASIVLGGEVLREVPVVALQAVEQGGIFKRLWHWFLLLLQGLLASGQAG